MRFFLAFIPLAVLAALVSAAPVDTDELVARTPPGGGGQYPSWKRSCPNGSQACGDNRREVQEARSCPNGRNGCE